MTRIVPDQSSRLLQTWSRLGEEHDKAAELTWRVEHWRLLNGDVLAFDAEEFRQLERRIAAHSGTWDNPAPHGAAEQSGPDRGTEPARVTVPTLVIDGPQDPIVPRRTRPAWTGPSAEHGW